jgi:hypothetical protein
MANSRREREHPREDRSGEDDDVPCEHTNMLRVFGSRAVQSR